MQHLGEAKMETANPPVVTFFGDLGGEFSVAQRWHHRRASLAAVRIGPRTQSCSL